MVELARRLPPQASPTLAVAFNKSIADELGSRLPSHITARTMNSLGYEVWRTFVRKRLRLDSRKTYWIVKDLLAEEYPDLDWRSIAPVVRLAAAAKVHGIIPTESPHASRAHPLRDNTPELWDAMAETHDVDPDLIPIAQQALTISVDEAFTRRIDFDDQLYMPVLFVRPPQWPKFRTILVDEAQDLNTLQHEMIANLLMQGGPAKDGRGGRGGRVIAFGDSHQAIYGFRGALYDSMALLRKRFSMTTLPLSASYRCPRTVIELAARDVPHITAAPGAPEGSVTHRDFEWTLDDFTAGDHILCRYNAPLVKLAMQFLKAKRPVQILGKDVAAGFNAMIDRVARQPMPVPTFLTKLNAHIEAEIERRKASEDRLRDQQAALIALADGARTTEDLKAAIKAIFESPAPITLSSIHKAKGLEWSRVWFLNPNPIPAKRSATEEEFQQEHNLRYVGITRAKHDLVFFDLPR